MDPNQNTEDESKRNTATSSSATSKIRNFLRKRPPKQRLAVVTGVSLGVLVAGVAGLQAYGPKAAEPNPEPNVVSTYVPPPPEPTTEASTLTGVQVDPELNKRPVTGIMIENSIDARPQAGLNEAGVVFEAIAEGGITRFLALFQTERPKHIGPIRSARPYYVRWAAGFDAAYVHSGGSPEALALIPSLGVKDMDHARHTGSFDRVTNRYAPHNVYTSMDRLDSLRESLGFTEKDFVGFDRIPLPEDEEEADQPLDTATPEVTSITFNISSANYNTKYTYDAESNTYKRVMAGQPHTDERSGDQIAPSVVIALEATYGIHSNGIHSVYGNVGSGVITVYQNGEVIKGKWSKPTDTSALKFTTNSGDPLELEPGQTWITAIQPGKYSHQ